MNRIIPITAALIASLTLTLALDPGTGSRTVSTDVRAEETPVESEVVPGLETSFIEVPGLGGGAHRVRIGVLQPEGTPVADLLFLHGHADRLDNHRELFLSFAASGVRVISFDLPSHGETDAGPIDVWSFQRLAQLAGQVEHLTRSGDRPLILAGWSFGGLLATRIAQEPSFAAELSRPLTALMLENPAVSPLAFSGGDGVSKLRALTHDLSAPVAGPPSPASPFLDPVFAGRLLGQAAIARGTPLPADVPTFALLSDPAEDQYIDPTGVETWLQGIGSASGAAVTISRCTGARHGTDFETWPIGAGARSDLRAFLSSTVGARPSSEAEPAAVQEACQ